MGKENISILLFSGAMMKSKNLLLIFLQIGLFAHTGAQNLPTQTSTLFSGSGNCASCHQAGSLNSTILRDGQGNDVSPESLWRSTMMANATKDPFWQAKMTAEVAANPHLKDIIEDRDSFSLGEKTTTSFISCSPW